MEGAVSMTSSPQQETATKSPTKKQRAAKIKLLYRRPLPECCIAFASDEGKTIFREALATGHLNCYFPLASQFRTQDEPAYCGLATLVMVLNAFEIDPGRVWKGPWKWYHEDMLDCCLSMEIIRKEGITFDEFVCLAECNYLQAESERVDSSSREDDFRTLVKIMTMKDNIFLVVSYSRKALDQTGDGHFATVSGYHPDRDLILILDTARFKYPPHWVPLSLLFESMKRLDKSTGLPRGYIKLQPVKNAKNLLLFKTSDQFCINANDHSLENYEEFLLAWNKQLTASLSTDDANAMAAVVQQAIEALVKTTCMLDEATTVLKTQEHISCIHGGCLKVIMQQLLAELEATEMFQTICFQVVSMPQEAKRQLENVFGVWPSTVKAEGQVRDVTIKEDGKQPCCDMTQALCLCHFVTAFFLSWPYSFPPIPPTLGSTLHRMSEAALNESNSQLLMDEMTSLHRQLKKLSGYHSPSTLSPEKQVKPCCRSQNKPCCQAGKPCSKV